MVAVSPINAGRAVKGPTAKMMSELGLEVSATAVARRYRDLLDAYVLDRADTAAAAELGIPVTQAHTLMTTLADREELARHVLTSADAVAKATAAAVARRYQDLLDAYVLDHADAADAAELGIPVTLAHTLMATLADREDLARRVLASADTLAKAPA